MGKSMYSESFARFWLVYTLLFTVRIIPSGHFFVTDFGKDFTWGEISCMEGA